MGLQCDHEVMSDFSAQYGTYALVTGASAGIGEEFARQLARRGLNLVLVARREEKLSALAAALTEAADIDVKVIALDLVSEHAVAELEKATEALDIGLAVLNAGVLVTGAFLDQSRETHTDLVLLNSVRPMQLAHHFGSRLVQRGRGGIILVASLVGEHPTPYEATYAASKAFVSSFGQALHTELVGTGVDITVLAPGLVDTPMVRDSAVDVTNTQLTVTGPEPVVRAALDGLGKKALVIPGATNKLADIAFRVLPRPVAVRLGGRIMRQVLTQPGHAG